jgi:hypothetical protein
VIQKERPDGRFQKLLGPFQPQVRRCSGDAKPVFLNAGTTGCINMTGINDD